VTFSERFEVFTAVKIQIVVFWVVTPYSDVVGYQHFGGPYSLHLRGDVISCHITVQRHTQKTMI
jgi:hypothetical protein